MFATMNAVWQFLPPSPPLNIILDIDNFFRCLAGSSLLQVIVRHDVLAFVGAQGTYFLSAAVGSSRAVCFLFS